MLMILETICAVLSLTNAYLHFLHGNQDAALAWSAGSICWVFALAMTLASSRR